MFTDDIKCLEGAPGRIPRPDTDVNVEPGATVAADNNEKANIMPPLFPDLKPTFSNTLGTRPATGTAGWALF